MALPGKRFPWEEKLVRSGFFVGAVLLHLVIFVLVASYVIFRPPPMEPEVKIITPPLPPPTQEPPPTPPSSVAATGAAVSVDPISTSNPEAPVAPIHAPIKMQGVNLGGPIGSDGPRGIVSFHPAPMVPSKGISPERAEAILKFELAHRSLQNIRQRYPDGDYPVFVASYADGDWSCNTNLDADGNIVAGSIPNLAAKIQEWTHNSVRAHVVAKPLKIAGPDLMAQQPPFIFFTGHKDFVLTDEEVKNLQSYVAEGGAIWGDNAEAGIGSRFDVAFRREMKRVIPSEPFQPLATDAEIFKGRYQFEETPKGMNYLAEPIEHVDLDGKLAILYTPNDYSDLYTMRILPGDEEIEGTLPTTNSPLITSGLFLGNSSLYFRNYTLPSSLAVQHLGLNIVTYLVTRFDDILQLAPP